MISNNTRHFFLVLAFFLCYSFSSQAQAVTDTLVISRQEAINILLHKNSNLVAAKYNIAANAALAEQARLWDNPVLNTDQNIYDGKFFRHTANNGQVYVQLMQLFSTAGKHSKLARLSTDNAEIATLQYADLLRTLTYNLSSDFLEINHQLAIIKLINQELEAFQKLQTGLDAELKVGNISLKDDLRIKAVVFSLQNDLSQAELAMQIPENEIGLLLQTNDFVFVKPVSDETFDFKNDLLPLDSLVTHALRTRPDAQVAVNNLLLQQDNLTYQKALAKPDITAGVEYDRLSSYTPNYYGLAVSLPLNIFNRNQGNIKNAKAVILQQQSLNEASFASIKNEIISSLNKYTFCLKLHNETTRDFSDQYEKLFSGMINSYRSRAISLLEFTDFADAYRDTKLKLLDQQVNLAKAAAELNYAANLNVIPSL